MEVPAPYELVLLAGAVYRIWQLVGNDTILDRPRDWITARSQKADTLLECPWCAGFWIGLIVYGCWQLWPHPTLVLAGLLSILTLVGLAAHFASD